MEANARLLEAFGVSSENIAVCLDDDRFRRVVEKLREEIYAPLFKRATEILERSMPESIILPPPDGDISELEITWDSPLRIAEEQSQ